MKSECGDVWSSESASMRGYIKVNIPEFIIATHDYFLSTLLELCIDVAGRSCWESYVVRFRPNQLSNVLRSFR